MATLSRDASAACLLVDLTALSDKEPTRGAEQASCALDSRTGAFVEMSEPFNIERGVLQGDIGVYAPPTQGRMPARLPSLGNVHQSLRADTCC